MKTSFAEKYWKLPVMAAALALLVLAARRPVMSTVAAASDGSSSGLFSVFDGSAGESGTQPWEKIPQAGNPVGMPAGSDAAGGIWEAIPASAPGTDSAGTAGTAASADSQNHSDGASGVQEGDADPARGVVTFVAVGDNLLHMPIVRYGQRNGIGYDFLFTNILPKLQVADLAVINQETPLIADPSRYHGYPMFGSPVQVADAIAAAGFDIVTCATNHSLDQGLDGVRDTIAAFSAHSDMLTYLGMHDSPEDAATIRVVDCNGIRFALLNYTYGTNGIPLPSSAPWCVDTFQDETRVITQLQQARSMADVVIVFAHWGTEYAYEPDSFQQKWTSIFLAQGVDVVVGGHPHVVQPCRMLTREDGHSMLVYYSLGNYVSCQDEKPRLLGGMAEFTFSKDSEGTRLIAWTEEPVVTLQTYPLVTSLMLADYTDEMALGQALPAPKADLEALFWKVMQQGDPLGSGIADPAVIQAKSD